MDSPASRPTGLSADDLATLLDALPMPAVVIDADDHLVAVNRTARTFFVVDARAPLASQTVGVALQVLGRTLTGLLRDAREGAPAITHTVSASDAHSYDVRVVRFDDTRVLLTASDVTEREQRRTTLVRTAREFDTLFELTPAAVRLIDGTGRILRANHHAATEHAGRTPTTVRELWEMDAPHDVSNNRPLPFLDAPAMRAFAGLTVVQHVLEVRRHEGHRTIEAHATPLLDDAGRVVGVLLLDRDISDTAVSHATPTPGDAPAGETDDARIAQLVEERSRDVIAAHEEQVRERRLAAIGQLAAGVMHDVNNALNPIMAAAYLLRHHAESPEAVKDYADRIRAAAEVGAATASRVGRFIRQEPMHGGEQEEFDLALLVEEVLDLTEPFRLRRSSETGAVHIVREFSPGLLVRVIPGEIREALLNLVQNAIDAMPGGGTLTVRTWAEGDDACVAVRDTGTGMTADVRERAFEPFFTTKGARGTGLGLAEVYGIVRRHRGTATISSEPGRGTEVVLRLPLARVATPDATPIVPPGPVEPRRILVVEDHDDGREFLRRILEGDGHAVTAVGTLAEARTRLMAGGAYDLLLTDVGLPDGSGWEVVRLARAQLPSIRVGVITGWEPSSVGGEASGAEFVLRKPLRAGELKAHIAGIPAQAPSSD